MSLPALLPVVLALLGQVPSTGGLTDGDRALLAREALQSDVRREAPSAEQLGAAVNVLPDGMVARNVQAVLAPLADHLRGLSVSCSGGQVTLSGEAASAAIGLRAGALADGVVGAREVVNRLSTPDSPAAAWNPPPVPELPAVTEPFAFLTQDRLCGAGIVVRVENDVIHLEAGLVGSDRARDYATDAAHFVPGARSVENHLDVLQTTPENDQRLGLIIGKRISYTSGLQQLMDGGHDTQGQPVPGLAVTVREGVATIAGHVEDSNQVQAITQIVLATKDVLVFDDQLVVDRRRTP